MFGRSALGMVLLLVTGVELEARPYQCRSFGYSSRIERPAAPYCVDTLAISRDQYQFSACRAEIEAHRAEVERYLECLNAEGKEAAEEFSSLVRRFNCIAQGGYC